MSKTSRVLDEVLAERHKQDEKWGQQNHDPFKWLAILGEEFGEASKAALEAHFCENYQGADWADYREELIQVAAVAVAMVECFDRAAKAHPAKRNAEPPNGGGQRQAREVEMDEQRETTEADEERSSAVRCTALLGVCFVCGGKAWTGRKHEMRRVCEVCFQCKCPVCGYKAFWLTTRKHPYGVWACFSTRCNWADETRPA